MEDLKGCLKFVLILGAILFTLAVIRAWPDAHVRERGDITKGVNNVRQIFVAMIMFARENEGYYPEGSSANAVFRKLVTSQIVEKEDIFGCPGSIFSPDGNIGISPDYTEAAAPGENHWMYIFNSEGIAGEGSDPLLVEAPDMSTGVPLWDRGLAGTISPGRTWSKGRVIVCFNDGSVQSNWKTLGDGSTSILTDGHREIDFADPFIKLRHVELPERQDK